MMKHSKVMRQFLLMVLYKEIYHCLHFIDFWC